MLDQLCIECVNAVWRNKNQTLRSCCCKTNPIIASRWVGLMILIPGCLLEQQTTKMAEGPDPGTTPAKSESIFTSAVEIRNKKCIRSTDTFYHVNCVYIYCNCYLVISSSIAPATPTLKELSNALDSVVNWYSLGVKLGLEDHELSAIEQNYRGDRCKLEMLSCWLRNAKLPTWKAVADALLLMGENRVTWKIRAKYCSSFTDSADTAGMCP